LIHLAPEVKVQLSEGVPLGRALPLLLAPAGDWEAARAAVENGADAVYFGLETLNARLRARNFRLQELPELLRFLHRRGVRGYLTANTLVFPDELQEAEELLRSAVQAGIDALIVQDLGICRLARRLSSDVPLHASTQMTVSNAAGLRYAAAMGCASITLARELSLEEVAALVEPARSAGVQLEVFAHGALCVSYSGQCLASLAFGGRSGNRGACAQPCRLPYELLVDGEPARLPGRFPLSPRDLCTLPLISELVAIGVAALKIEGRLKSAEYVAATTRAYREALDGCAAGAEDPAGPPAELELTFSRGLGPGWYRGRQHRELVNTTSGQKRGIEVGAVVAIDGEQVTAHLTAPLEAGDGVLLGEGGPGGRVYSVEERGGRTVVGFERGLELDRARPGDPIWKTSDPAVERRLRQSFAGDAVRFARPVDLVVTGRAGDQLEIEARDELGHAVRVASDLALAPAERHPLDETSLRAQLGRLGGSPFRLRALEVKLEGQLMLPVSQLNRARRECVERLAELRERPPRWQLTEMVPAATSRAPLPADPPAPSLAVLVREPGQVAAAIAAGADALYLDLGERASQQRALAAGREAGLRVMLAGPRITKPGEERELETLRGLGPDGYLVRNAAQLEAFAGSPRLGDAALSATNLLAVEHLLGLGLTRVTAALDLGPTQLEVLLREAPAGALEVVVWLHEPLFHTELCLFCAHLGAGAECGEPCLRRRLRLRDRKGAEHPVVTDAACRTTVFHARPRDLSAELPRLLAAGARAFRCELLDETPEQVSRLLRRLRRAIEATG
jgi:U32 family peptidase